MFENQPRMLKKVALWCQKEKEEAPLKKKCKKGWQRTEAREGKGSRKKINGTSIHGVRTHKFTPGAEGKKIYWGEDSFIWIFKKHL